jgi:universal stress protein A
MKFKHILVTTDFSDESIRAFGLAASLALRDGAKVTLLSVLEQLLDPSAAPWGAPSEAMVLQVRERQLEGAKKRLEQLRQEHFSALTVSTEVFFGNYSSAQEIAGFAKANGVDLLVIASHGRGAVAGLLLGSVVGKVIKLSHCPVLVVPKGP